VWKPAAAAYDYAVAECGVEALDAMLVAVHPWDIDGASRAGLATAWLDRNWRPLPRLLPGARPAGELPDRPRPALQMRSLARRRSYCWSAEELGDRRRGRDRARATNHRHRLIRPVTDSLTIL